VQRLIDPADGGGGDDAALEELMAVHGLPQVLEPSGILPDEERLEIANGSDDRLRLPLERRLAPADETGNISDDLDEDPVPQSCVDDDGLDGGDLHMDLLAGWGIRWKRALGPDGPFDRPAVYGTGLKMQCGPAAVGQGE
jgi:hypothetical protein